MNNKITVTVTGGTASGKTTIADLIYEFLVEQGFDTGQIAFEELDDARRQKYKEERIQAIKDRAFIIIKEKQAKRSAL